MARQPEACSHRLDPSGLHGNTATNKTRRVVAIANVSECHATHVLRLDALGLRQHGGDDDGEAAGHVDVTAPGIVPIASAQVDERRQARELQAGQIGRHLHRVHNRRRSTQLVTSGAFLLVAAKHSDAEKARRNQVQIDVSFYEEAIQRVHHFGRCQSLDIIG